MNNDNEFSYSEISPVYYLIDGESESPEGNIHSDIGIYHESELNTVMKRIGRGNKVKTIRVKLLNKEERRRIAGARMRYHHYIHSQKTDKLAEIICVISKIMNDNIPGIVVDGKIIERSSRACVIDENECVS